MPRTAKELDIVLVAVEATTTMAFHIPHWNIFGSGFRLRAAITIACQMAFVLFGYDQGVFSGIVGNSDWLDRAFGICFW